MYRGTDDICTTNMKLGTQLRCSAWLRQTPLTSAAGQLRDDQRANSHCVTGHNLAIMPCHRTPLPAPRRNCTGFYFRVRVVPLFQNHLNNIQWPAGVQTLT